MEMRLFMSHPKEGRKVEVSPQPKTCSAAEAKRVISRSVASCLLGCFAVCPSMCLSVDLSVSVLRARQIFLKFNLIAWKSKVSRTWALCMTWTLFCTHFIFPIHNNCYQLLASQIDPRD